MAPFERGARLMIVLFICLMLLPIHTLPLQAAEKVVETSEVSSVEPQKQSLVKRLVGIATYYAKKFQGRKTSTGERYHPDKLTAAHQSLPLGTRVRVKNLDNDKEVTVVVNDRCRKRNFPFIDLSRAAAKKLGFIGAGRANVAIIPLKEEGS